jgi:hypothetical protein
LAPGIQSFLRAKCPKLACGYCGLCEQLLVAAEPLGSRDWELRREVGKPWAGRSIHEISKGDVVDVVSAIERRGAPVAANKTLKSIKTFLRWCVGRVKLPEVDSKRFDHNFS